MSNFKITNTDGLSRLGEYKTSHGTFETPNFMPVGTKASVKGITAETLEGLGAQIMLVNTYHLMLRPGLDIIKSFGGVHKFSGWSKTILSDSGGFQVFSLKGLRNITEKGVEFRSHIDGSKQFLSPEKAVQLQEGYGVNIAMAFDECPAAGLTFSEVEKSLDLTLRWAKRCIDARTVPERTHLFGITQGGKFKELRTKSASELSGMPFDGFAVGGVSVGEKKDVMYDLLNWHPQQLPSDKIRYLMGVGTPLDIITAVKGGIDLFDCVLPTRSGRFGRAFVRKPEEHSKNWTINIKNAVHRTSQLPIEEGCQCYCCRNYSRGYINHLFKSGEMLGPILLSMHNTYFYQKLMLDIREAIKVNRFQEFYKELRLLDHS